MGHVIARRAATKQSLKERLLCFAGNDKGSGQSKNEVDINELFTTSPLNIMLTCEIPVNTGR